MVFSSLPIFLDPPNWGQMQMQQQQQPPLQCLLGGGSVGSDHHHLMPPPSGLAPLPGGPADTAASAPAGGGSSTSMQAATAAAQPRPVVSMAERARLARVPLPEPGTLRCPRCDSTNTKFCYFNNYSLSQPRHFCKACRRYWTRGGALRNVPVGGGCRRNTKRSSKKSSRSGGAGGATAATSSSSTTSTSTTATTTTATTTSAAMAAAEAIASMQAQLPHLGLPPAAAAAALEASLEGYHHYLPLQMQPQFLQQAAGLHGYHFADDGSGVLAAADGFPRGVVASGLLAQLAAVKMEEHSGGGGGGGGGAAVAAHEQSSYWPGSVGGGGGGGGWPAEFLSGFSSSSSGNVL